MSLVRECVMYHVSVSVMCFFLLCFMCLVIVCLRYVLLVCVMCLRVLWCHVSSLSLCYEFVFTFSFVFSSSLCSVSTCTFS